MRYPTNFVRSHNWSVINRKKGWNNIENFVINTSKSYDIISYHGKHPQPSTFPFLDQFEAYDSKA